MRRPASEQLPNPNTQRAYVRNVRHFMTWLGPHGVASIKVVNAVHVALYVEQLGQSQAAPSVKLSLAAIRSRLDRLAAGGALPRRS